MPAQVLLPPALKDQLLANGRRTAAGEEIDPIPVVKLFLTGSAATWLLTELDPEDQDRAFGLCFIGPHAGEPDLGYVSIAELKCLNSPKRLMFLERDEHIRFDKPLSAYAKQARMVGRIDTAF